MPWRMHELRQPSSGSFETVRSCWRAQGFNLRPPLEVQNLAAVSRPKDVEPTVFTHTDVQSRGSPGAQVSIKIRR